MGYYDNHIDESEAERINALFVGRKVAKVAEDRLRLDDGTELQIVANRGCGGCSNGWYELKALNECDNAITRAEVVEESLTAGRMSGLRTPIATRCSFTPTTRRSTLPPSRATTGTATTARASRSSSPRSRPMTRDSLSSQSAVAPDYIDVGPFDPDELVQWAERYGHPEGWAKKAQSLHAKSEDLREALQSIWIYLRLEPGQQDHTKFGEACGVDACILCLAESVAKKALRS